MILHEIRPKQLRALLLLLVIVPFIPMVLMLRFISDALRSEREAAVERLGSVQQQTLASAAASFEKQRMARGAPLPAAEVREFFRAVFASEMDVCVADGAGRIIAGAAPPGGLLLAQTALNEKSESAAVQVFLADRRWLDESVREQFKVYAWTALTASLAICAIAATAGWTVHRQLRLHELKNTAVATVAHELRTPLATMRMLVETLRAGRYRNDQQLGEYLELIHAENLRMSRLTEHFLTHAQIARGQPALDLAPVSMKAIAEDAVAALQPRLSSPGCTFQLDLHEPLPEVVADHDGLVTVLRNLLENALKYSGDDKRIVLRISATGKSAIFAVEDNGVGLAPADRRQIFEPFYQVDGRLSRSREGTGLGLSIARGIVQAHRGRIEVESTPNCGSIFTVTLPVKPA